MTTVIDFIVVSFPGPQSPDVTHVQVTPGRALGIAVFWSQVRGANLYLVWTSNGQNCSTENSYCYINPADCGQNHSVYVIAYNDAGPSSPSEPANYITCGYIIRNVWLFVLYYYSFKALSKLLKLALSSIEVKY